MRFVVKILNLAVAVTAGLFALANAAGLQSLPDDRTAILKAVAVALGSAGPRSNDAAAWYMAPEDSAAIDLAKAAGAPFLIAPRGSEAPPCPWNPAARAGGQSGGYDVAVQLLITSADSARVRVAFSCVNPPGWTHRTYYLGRDYSVVRVGGDWTARLESMQVTMLHSHPLPNSPLKLSAAFGVRSLSER
jgi:uncharacterized protein YbjT (DUF2867 family)